MKTAKIMVMLRKLEEITELDFVTAEIMPAIVFALSECTTWNQDACGYQFDCVSFMEYLREYDLHGLNADGLIDIVLTIGR